MKRAVITAVLLASVLAAAPALGATLRMAIQEDPDALDPILGSTYGGRVVFAALCDKLVDITPDLQVVPMLATSWEWGDGGKSLTLKLREGVTFHDGTPFDAEAVKFNIDRARSQDDSKRKAELASVQSVEIVDDHTARLNLSAPNVPLLIALTDRAGMMVSPAAVEKAGADFAAHPVCSGPYEFVERQQRDFIKVKKYAPYWNAANIFYDDISYLYIEDPTVRLARLQAGDIEIAERVAPTDLDAIKNNPKLQLVSSPSLATTHLHVGPVGDTPLTKDPKVREAFELALDRDVINQVAFNGQFIADNQMNSPLSPYHIAEYPNPKRDVARAKELLKEAGYDRVPVELISGNASTDLRVTQIVQSLAAEAGFDVKLLPLEGAAASERYFGGKFELFLGNWSGRSDPDLNVYAFFGCKGAQNWNKYCNQTVEDALLAARADPDQAKRYELYKAATGQIMADRPAIPIYHTQWFFGVSKKVTGLVMYPDGLSRLVGVKPAP